MMCMRFWMVVMLLLRLAVADRAMRLGYQESEAMGLLLVGFGLIGIKTG